MWMKSLSGLISFTFLLTCNLLQLTKAADVSLLKGKRVVCVEDILFLLRKNTVSRGTGLVVQGFIHKGALKNTDN